MLYLFCLFIIISGLEGMKTFCPRAVKFYLLRFAMKKVDSVFLHFVTLWNMKIKRKGEK